MTNFSPIGQNDKILENPRKYEAMKKKLEEQTKAEAAMMTPEALAEAQSRIRRREDRKPDFVALTDHKVVTEPTKNTQEVAKNLLGNITDVAQQMVKERPSLKGRVTLGHDKN